MLYIAESSYSHDVVSVIKPTDFIRQSMPFSYLAVSAMSNDGNPHTVQVYTDISGEWITSNTSMLENWTTSLGSVITHQVQLENQTMFAQVSDRIMRKSNNQPIYSITNNH